MSKLVVGCMGGTTNYYSVSSCHGHSRVALEEHVFAFEILCVLFRDARGESPHFQVHHFETAPVLVHGRQRRATVRHARRARSLHQIPVREHQPVPDLVRFVVHDVLVDLIVVVVIVVAAGG